MNHWYVYHSIAAMGCSYADLGAPAAYSTTSQPRLCFGDAIWIVEGSLNQPRRYALVDCFKYADTEYAPFGGLDPKFKMRFLGERSLLASRIELSTDWSWFAELHKGFITKQRFFECITKNSGIVSGLCAASGIHP